MRLFLILILAVFPILLDAVEARPLSLRETVDSLSAEDLKETLRVLRENYVKPDALSEAELSRATIQGLIERQIGRASCRERV